VKKVLNILKQRWLPIVCVVVVLAALPTAWIFSSKWNDEIIATAQDNAGNKLNELRRAKVTYLIPSVVPGQPDVQLAVAPNPTLTSWVAEQRKQRLEQTRSVLDDATKRNKGAHAPIVDGLFPKPPGDAAALSRQMRTYLETMLGNPARGQDSWYTKALKAAGAGTALDAGALAQLLAEQREREEALAAAQNESGQITAEQQQMINENLVNRRIGEVRRHAQAFSFYADQSVLGDKAFAKSAVIPPPSMEDRAGARAPSHEEGFVWMADAWVLQDLLAAITKANTGLGGERTEVEQSAVKRILSIGIEELPIFASNNQGRGEDEGQSQGPLPTLDAETGRIPLDPSISVTGRLSSTTNQLYDVRRARISMIVASEKLPAIINAFHSTSLMTVTDVDLESIDVWEHMRNGYAYGNEHVVKASMEVEILLLRSWTVPLMPESIRMILGVTSN
jgi:hypothetical protein